MPVEQILNAAKEVSISDFFATFFSILQYPAVTLLTAMLLEIILPINASWRLSNLAPLFSKLAKKVNRQENSLGQTIFSSVFLPFFLLCIAIFTILLLRFCINHDTIVSLLILPFLLESKPVLKTTLQVKRSLEHDDKELAKKYLQKIMLRDCSNLSLMGVCKANSEAVAVGLFANWFSVMVWYMLLGIEGALIMQMVAVMNRSFSFKEKRTETFGIFIYKFEQALLVPSLIVYLLTMIFSIHIVRIYKNFINHLKYLPNPVTSLVIDTLGSYANVSLGGPRYYEGKLVRLARIGGENEPDLYSPLKIYNKLRFSGILFVCFCVVVRIFLYSAA